MSSIKIFMYGAQAMLALVGALFFARFWRASSERIFGFFATAFVFLAADSAAQVLLQPAVASRHYVFLLRLIAFGLIICGIVDKNRARAAR